MTTVKNIERWLAELESGKHKQTMDFLQHTDRFCCLGVACRFVLELDGVWAHDDDAITFTDPSTGSLSYNSMPGQTYLNLGLRDHIGTSTTDIIVNGGEEYTPLNSGRAVSLVDLNDGGMSFEMIARVLRQDLDADTPPFGFFEMPIYTAWKAR